MNGVGRHHYRVALLALQLADVATTWVALGIGTHHEGNVFAAWVLHFGLPGLLLVKLLGTGILVLLHAGMGPPTTRIGRWGDATLAGCCLIMLLVVVNNWSVLLHAKP